MSSITPIPAFKDNYIWLLENAGETWVVDPGDAEPVQRRLEESGKQLDGILITHHHRDHIGGVAALLQPGMRVVGPALDAQAFTTEPLGGGEQVRIAGLDFKVLAVPGHTLNHTAYYAEPEGEAPLLFCGDTLFVAGCGRIFEGTPAQMYESLGTLRALPENTRVYCAHEYTLANLKFARAAEPDNARIRELMDEVERLRAEGQPSVPSTIGTEREVNPFFRAAEKTVKAGLAQSGAPQGLSDLESFTRLREWKNNF